MRVSLKSVLAAGLAMGAMAFSASAAPLTISSTVDQNGAIDSQTPGGAHVFTAGLGYDFTGQQANTLTSIDSLTVTLSINDGDSAVGEFDFNNLFLTLDGINTGLALNGFTDGNIITLTLTQLAPVTGAAILAALQADNHLIGGVLDTDADGGPVGDIISFPSLVQTTLDITGQSTINGGGGNPVPLPAAMLLAPLGAGLAGIYSRRFRRQK